MNSTLRPGKNGDRELELLTAKLKLLERIVDARRTLGVSQSQLAQTLGISQARIAKLESGGDISRTSFDVLFRTMLALGLRPEFPGITCEHQKGS